MTVQTTTIDFELCPVGTRPRILFTGSRHWDDRNIIMQVLFLAWLQLGQAEDATLVHGAAHGADAIAAGIWGEIGLPLEAHPANWRRWGNGAGYLRNKAMVQAGADVCLAFIRDESKGATMCAQMAENAGIPVRRFLA